MSPKHQAHVAQAYKDGGNLFFTYVNGASSNDIWHLDSGFGNHLIEDISIFKNIDETVKL